MKRHPDPHIAMGQLLREAQDALGADPANPLWKKRVDDLTLQAAARRLLRKAEVMLGDAKARRSAYPGGVLHDLEEVRALADIVARGLDK